MALLQRTLEEKGNVTGLIPRGPGAIAIMGQVLNGAAQNNPNLSLAGVGGTYESKTAALKKLQTTTAMTNAFEQTALKNLDNMMAQAQGLADLGGPFINGPLRAGMKQFAGNPRVASFEAARQTAVQEVSKVLNNAVAGGVISDSNRTEINRMLAGDMTIAQMQAVVRTLKQDMTNRHSAYGEAITGLQQELGGGAQPQQGGAPAAAPPAMDRQTLRDLYLKQK
jgi:hypothetical protein